MKRLAVIFLLIFAGSLFPQSKSRLGETEIKNAPRVNFVNRSNKRAAGNTRSEHDRLGLKLSKLTDSDPINSHTIKGVTARRYMSKDGKFGGDIITLSKETSYGHINSIHRILTSYIQNSFEYSEDNSETIAFYVLYYNAMHRKDMEYFKEKYTPVLSAKLSESSTGIGTTYRDWPGRTQIIIPIEKTSDKDKDINLTELDKEVGPTVEEKKGGSEIKEKFDEIKKTREEEKKAAIEEKPKSEPRKEETVQPKRDSTEKIKTSESNPPKKEETPIRESKKEEIKTEPRPESIASNKDTSEKVPVRTLEETKKLEADLAKAKEQVETLKKEQKDKEEKSENVIGDKILFLKLIKYESDGHYTNELWMLDTVNDNALYKSPYANICGKEFAIGDEGVVVLGFEGTNTPQRVHHLVLLDKDKLSVKKVAKEEIFWRSQIIYRDGEKKFYVFDQIKGKVYLSRFNPDLTLDARSSEPVNTSSEITFHKEKIFLTGKSDVGDDTTIRMLRKSDLKVMKVLKPLQ